MDQTKGEQMRTAITLGIACALSVPAIAEYQIDLDPSSLPHGFNYSGVSGCLSGMDGNPLGCFDAVISGSSGFPVMDHAVWTIDAQVQLAWFSSMILSIECNGYPLVYTLDYAPYEVVYHAGPADPPMSGPTDFGVDSTIDCLTYTADAIDQPGQFTLGHAFPNPFNPSTTIPFALPAAEKVTLTVFNIHGQKVASLAEGLMVRGTHEVTFDASALSSGVYMVTIEAGDFTATRKMVLLK